MSDDAGALTALVLAGGEARRMQGSKADLEIGGRTLLDRALDLAGAVADETVLLPGSRALASDAARSVPDWEAPAGPLGALGAGLEAAAHPWCLLLPCDMPLVTAEVVAGLRRRATAGAAVVAPRSDRGLEPFCALYRSDLVEPLRKAVAEGATSLHEFLDALDVTAVDAAELDPSLRFLFNVNTPDDVSIVQQGVPS